MRPWWCAAIRRCRRPQQFANRQIGVPFFFGTHYLTLQMLEGFVPRDLIKLGRVPNGSPYRFKLLMDGVIDATTLTEPYISLAEKMGCRMVVAAFHHGTEVASDRVDAETYSAFNRGGARGGAAHQRQQAQLHALLHRLLQEQGSADRPADHRRPAREPALPGRSGADPGR